MALYRWLVSRSTTVTVAPGMTASLGSTTDPVKVPVRTWAETGEAEINALAQIKAAISVSGCLMDLLLHPFSECTVRLSA
jgi:hypothetical protein